VTEIPCLKGLPSLSMLQGGGGCVAGVWSTSDFSSPPALSLTQQVRSSAPSFPAKSWSRGILAARDLGGKHDLLSALPPTAAGTQRL